MVTGGQRIARIAVLLVLRRRWPAAVAPHLYVRVLLICVLFQVVALAHRLPHHNFGLLHHVEASRRDRSLLTTISMCERGCIGSNWGRVLRTQGLSWVEFL